MNKNILLLKELLILVVLIYGSNSVLAYDFEVDGLYYNKLSESTVEVTSNPDYYEGEVSIPSTIKVDKIQYDVISIGDSAFCYCWRVTSISLPNSITSIGKSAFNTTGIAEIKIPVGVTRIEDNTFKSCWALAIIDFPEGLISIGNNAFSNCSNLALIEIPESITSIEESAFANCDDLTTIYLPNGAYEIGKSAFAYCDKISKIYCKADEPPTCNGSVFSSKISSDCTLYVPNESIEKYKNASVWKSFENICAYGDNNPGDIQTCGAPTITFDNETKELHVASTTEGATIKYLISSDDVSSDESTENDVTLSGVYTIYAYASAEGMYNSERVTAKLCWVSAAIESDGIMNAKADRGVIVSTFGNQVTISGTVNGETIEVYNVGGSKLMVVKANDGNTTISGLQSGNVYIVKICGTKVKVIL